MVGISTPSQIEDTGGVVNKQLKKWEISSNFESVPALQNFRAKKCILSYSEGFLAKSEESRK